MFILAVNYFDSFLYQLLLIQAVLDLALEVFTEGRDEKVMDILQLPLHPDAFDEISKPTVTTSCYFFQAAKHLYNSKCFVNYSIFVKTPHRQKEVMLLVI